MSVPSSAASEAVVPRGAKPKQYDDGLVTAVRALYVAGMSQVEIAHHLSLTQKVVWNLMRRHGIAARPATPRNQSGERNSQWLDTDAGYQAKHTRIARLCGTPSECERCGSVDPNKVYDWANLTGDYDNPADYQRMCRSCHRQFDNARSR
jgi:hypothetical protein